METQIGSTLSMQQSMPVNTDTGKDAGSESTSTIVIGGGQAGLSVGYHLKKRGIPFIILDGGRRIGDTWRSRWDSLRLFTPAKYDALDGMSFPTPPNYFPTKDEMADYLEGYVKKFALPVRLGVKVDNLTREQGKFIVTAGRRRFEADNVVVAMASYQQPSVPAFAAGLDPQIIQMHSSEYKNPSQLRAGGVLLVGGGNSGSEIAMELSRDHKVWMAGRDTGHIPFRIQSKMAMLLFMPVVLRFLFHRVLTIKTPMGRAVRRKALTSGGPLIRVKPSDLKKAGVVRTPRVAGVRDGKPVLEDGSVPDVTNVIWCTGFHPGFSWIGLPVHGDVEPEHQGGIVKSLAGLYFVGLHFLYAFSSTMIHGIGRDAERIAKAIALRSVKKR